MGSRRLRVAILGETGHGDYGHQIHLGFAECPDVEVVAVADADDAGRRAAATRLGASRSFSTLDDMLRWGAFDAVVVASRNVANHASDVRSCLEAGMHVYCEKPFVQNLVDADALVSLAEARGLKLAVALPGGHEPRFKQTMGLIAAGAIGDVTMVRGLCKWDYRGGGEDALVLGLHFVDMSMRLLGPIRTVHGRVSLQGRSVTVADAVRGGEGVGAVAGDAFVGTFHHDQGISTIESFRFGINDRELHPYRLEITGSRGQISHRAPYADGVVAITDEVAASPERQRWRVLERDVVPYWTHHRRGASDFAAAIREGREAACSGIDGARALEAIHAVYRSSLDQAVVTLPLGDRRHPLEETVGVRS
ncbi:MAG: Gfo/Idh/MocA family protein [Leucobacter sp.]|uniref:Gfo/Idh/MocA family protein n=1 Tax=Agrococcus casei TaxID=343512 RepID=UPI003F926971